MRTLTTELPGVLIVEPAVHRDGRGLFAELYHAERYRAAGIDVPFVQDNYSRSAERTLRGLHAQLAPSPQGKLVCVVRGEILDVAVDVRRGSPTFGRWVSARLSDENLRQLFLPPGCLHGFFVLSGPADVIYKCTAPWNPAAEIAVRWDDPELAVDWPARDPLLSPRDAAAPPLAEVRDRLPAWAG